MLGLPYYGEFDIQLPTMLHLCPVMGYTLIGALCPAYIFTDTLTLQIPKYEDHTKLPQ